MNGLRLSVLLCAAQLNRPHNRLTRGGNPKGELHALFIQMLGEPVVDANGEKIGSVSDLAIQTGEVFPASPAWHSLALAKRLS